jgi:diguanylate cyclase
MLTRIFELTGIPVDVLGLQLHITIYLPMLLCLPMSLLLGYFWGAIPAYCSTFLVALLGDMPLVWIVLFSFANPIGLAMLVLLYKIIPAQLDMRNFHALVVFAFAAFLSALSGSIGSFIWTYTNQVNLHDFFRVWQGWWLGGFLQNMMICAPLLWLVTSPIIDFKQRHFAGQLTSDNSRKTIKSGIILVTLVLIAFTFLAFKVGVMNISDHVSAVDNDALRTQILTAVQVIEFPILIYVIVLALVGYFAFYFIDYWTLRLEQANVALKAQNEQLYQSSITDPLTGVHNRGYVFEQFENLVSDLSSQDHPLAVMLMDLDHFKNVNDQFGHQAGDDVLKSFASAVSQSLPDGSVFGRFGGEEFILVTPVINKQAANQLAEQINQICRNLVIEHASGRISFTTSGGVFVTNDDRLSVDHMIEQADLALYEAKNKGRDQSVITASFRQ